MEQAHILVIADELAVVQSCNRFLSRAGHEVESVLTVQEAVGKLDETEYDVILFDLKLAGNGGAELMERLKAAHPNTPVIVLHGLATLAASEILGHGTYESIPKPISSDTLFMAMSWALQQRTMRLQAKLSTEDLGDEFGELVGNGPAMIALFRLIQKIAPTNATVLIIGHKGAGKKRVARALHRISPRRVEPYLDSSSGVNRGIELSRILFGEVESHFGVDDYEPGKIRLASRGTLYLNEISRLDHWGQHQMISAIKQRTYMPLNGRKEETATCRFILGTSRNLKESVEDGSLIEEFYDQVKLYPIYLPSLAERAEDIAALTYQFLQRFSQRFGKKIEYVEDPLIARLIARPWPGNIRELERTVERMVAVCEGNSLTLDHYREAMGDSLHQQWNGKPPETAEELKELKKQLRQFAVIDIERAFVTSALHRSGGNVTRAADRVGMKRRNFQAMMREYGIQAG
ncbi:MAG: sigma-54-dependent Fis family transcriptional regulator [Calditrichaeota bacterium]|nr:sigma-54-dependent Fis family transcriptional regulator [Calditrichota bacterium]